MVQQRHHHHQQWIQQPLVRTIPIHRHHRLPHRRVLVVEIILILVIMLFHRHLQQQQSMDIIRQISMQLRLSWPHILPLTLIVLILPQIIHRVLLHHQQQLQQQP